MFRRELLALTTLLALLVCGAPAQAADSLRDCPDCPEMMAIPAGEVLMGSPENEAGRSDDGREGPQRRAVVAQPFALARHEVTVGEFRRFVDATAYRTDAERGAGGPGCLGWDATKKTFAVLGDAHWRNPGFAQEDRHPVTCVSWNDANAYVAWLSRRSGKTYRLPTEAEWELAARAGSSTSRPWGEDPAQACLHANVADASAASLPERHACDDHFPYTAPVGSYAANALGLYDMIGNVWEWMGDCYWKDAYGRPAAVTAAADTPCADHGLRGGSWFSGPQRARSAYRGGYAADSRSNMYGFRLARTLP